MTVTERSYDNCLKLFNPHHPHCCDPYQCFMFEKAGNKSLPGLISRSDRNKMLIHCLTISHVPSDSGLPAGAPAGDGGTVGERATTESGAASTDAAHRQLHPA